MNIQEYKELQKRCVRIVDELLAAIYPGIMEYELFKIAVDIIKNNPLIQGIWHPIVIKFDEATLIEGVKYNPQKNRKLKEIAIIDLGIISDDMELDFARSYGVTEEAKELCDKANFLLNKMQRFLNSNNNISPREAYRWLCAEAKKEGVTQLASHAGHVIGKFPTKKSGIKISEQSNAESLTRGLWMLEVHITNGRIAAFAEDFINY